MRFFYFSFSTKGLYHGGQSSFFLQMFGILVVLGVIIRFGYIHPRLAELRYGSGAVSLYILFNSLIEEHQFARRVQTRRNIHYSGCPRSIREELRCSFCLLRHLSAFPISLSSR